MSNNCEEQNDEIEALKSIYEDDFTEISLSPPCFMIKVMNVQVELTGPVPLRIEFPDSYPYEIPGIELPMRSGVLSSDQCKRLALHLKDVAESSIGMAMVFTLVEEVKLWIAENVQSPGPGNEEEVDVESETNTNIPHLRVLTEAKVAGGRWDFVIGLVGKPSAGKSTFFNAATTLDVAKTGAHPFTTIEPNIGKAFYSIPCPCSRLGTVCGAAYGHTYTGERHVPVLLKDVAGLVPGAWQGKGRGNRFLHDLLDADVLVHVLDVSGRTDEKGQTTEEYDPSKDVLWVQEELHQWIYQNIMDKWDGIKRRPQKLVDMFTGYHATRATIHSAFDRAGITDKELSQLSSWGNEELHKIVTEFLNVRFPMLVVLNKCDTATAQNNIKRLTSAYPNLPCLAVSALSECRLQRFHRDGSIAYQYGSNDFTVSHTAKEQDKLELQRIKNDVLDVHGSTNVHKALCQAVGLKAPVYAFPVQSLDTLRAVNKDRVHSNREAPVLRDCLCLKPGTTVDDLYHTMLHYPTDLCSGDFVRAETINCDDVKRPMKKDEKISGINNIIKIMTTKRSTKS